MTDYRALYIEAQARLFAIEGGVGDFGGPFHVHDVYDLAMWIGWTGHVYVDPPDWDGENDPLNEAPDDDLMEAAARGRVLTTRLRDEMVQYHVRAPWRPWWRTTPAPAWSSSDPEKGSR